MESDEDTLALLLEVEGEVSDNYATAQSEALATDVSLECPDDPDDRHAEIYAMVNANAGVAPSESEDSDALPAGPVPDGGPLSHDGGAVAGS
eukprot:4286081-Pyramimonas_sp.AAC.1